MSSRSNACSELTRFWIEARHGCLVSESAPVPVPYGLSDIDLVAMQPALRHVVLPDGQSIGPRMIIETKDEHDWDPSGREFGKLLRADSDLFGDHAYIRTGTAGSVKFSMLRQAHFEVACEIFGTDDFDRLFVVHAMNQSVLAALASEFRDRRIYWLTIQDVVRDLRDWYRSHSRPAGLRHDLMGDVWHLLHGYCGLDIADDSS